MNNTRWDLDLLDTEVGDLATRTSTYPATLRCGDIERLFTRDPSLGCIIVRREDGMQAGTVAEGIEEPEQSVMLERMGCDSGQGFLFAAPFPQEQAMDAMRRSISSTRGDTRLLPRAG